MFEDPAIQSLFFGLLSAASLPLGAVVSFYWRPPSRIVAVLMAFGGGALLAALTIDLVAEALARQEFLPLAVGCVMGGLLFDALNQIVNNNGGFLRKSATTMFHLRRRKRKEFEDLFETLSRMHFFQQLPPEEIRALVPCIHRHTYRIDEPIFKQGDDGNSLCIIHKGEVDIVDEKGGGKHIARLVRNDIFGEMALLTGAPRSATAMPVTETHIWVISKQEFDGVLSRSPVLAEAVEKLAEQRIGELEERASIPAAQAREWAERARKSLSEGTLAPTDAEIQDAAKAEGGAPLAIWLGILLDGIPESLVIGASLIPPAVAAGAGGSEAEIAATATISFSLIAGLFLSNFPESLSSSVGMREHGLSKSRIFWMWASLMVLTGIGALLGNLMLAGAPAELFPIIEGIAAGAMLNMIAQTMLPEAYHKGGAITGISTLAGFLAAIFFKTLEPSEELPAHDLPAPSAHAHVEQADASTSIKVTDG